MKKLLLFTAVGLLATQLSAQSIEKLQIPSFELQENNLSDQMYSLNTNQESSALPEAAGDTVWIEDFSNGIPAGWTLSGADAASCPWRYTFTGSNGFFNGSYPTAAGPMNSASAANGFLLCDPDSTNQSVNGQPSGSNYVYLESYITTAAIDLSGEPFVKLEFEQSFRYNNAPDMEVSVSTDGINWTIFEAKGSISANSASPDPMKFSQDVSSLVGGSATAYIKIGWSARVYFWMIDDIRFVVPPANDMAINTAFYQTAVDTGITKFYSMIPLSQATMDTIQFSANVTNQGASIQTGVKFNNVYTTPNGSTTLSSAPVSVNSGATDSLIIATTIVLDQGIGDYSWVYSVDSDSTDDVPADNMLDTVNVSVTDSTYARDVNAGGNSWYGPGSSFEIGPLFTIYDSVKATSVTVGVGAASADGETFSIYIYDNNFNLVVSREFITYDSVNNAGMAVPYSIPETVLAPGQYIVTYKTYTDALYFSRSSIDADPQTVFVDPSAGGTWFYTSTIPVVRLNVTSNLFVCDLAATAVQTANNTGVVTATAGTAPYSYLWDNGDATATATNLTSSLTGTTHTVTVTDDSACVVTASALIVSGLIEAGIKGDVSIYPNPNNGNFQLNLEGVFAGEYNLTVTNIVGQVVYQNVLNVNGNYNGNVELSNMQSGIYFMEIANNNGEKSVIRFVVK